MTVTIRVTSTSLPALFLTAFLPYSMSTQCRAVTITASLSATFATQPLHVPETSTGLSRFTPSISSTASSTGTSVYVVFMYTMLSSLGGAKLSATAVGAMAKPASPTSVTHGIASKLLRKRMSISPP